MDLHTSTLVQMTAYELIKDGFLERSRAHISGGVRVQRRNVMLDALERYFPEGTKLDKTKWRTFLMGDSTGRNRHPGLDAQGNCEQSRLCTRISILCRYSAYPILFGSTSQTHSRNRLRSASNVSEKFCPKNWPGKSRKSLFLHDEVIHNNGNINYC